MRLIIKEDHLISKHHLFGENILEVLLEFNRIISREYTISGISIISNQEELYLAKELFVRRPEITRLIMLDNIYGLKFISSQNINFSKSINF